MTEISVTEQSSGFSDRVRGAEDCSMGPHACMYWVFWIAAPNRMVIFREGLSLDFGKERY